MIERAEHLHRQFFHPHLSDGSGPNWEPPVDIFENDEEFCIVVALPGVDPRNLEVRIESGTIVVRGLQRLPAVSGNALIHRLEIPYGRFERRIQLPAVDQISTRSEIKDGCLVLRCAK